MIGLVLATAIFAQSDEAVIEQPVRYQRVCTRSVRGEGGSRMDVEIRLRLNGKRTGQEAVWTPPKLAGSQSAADPSPDAPVFQIGYDVTRRGQLGRPSFVTALTHSRAPGLWKKGKILLSLDNGPAVPTFFASYAESDADWPLQGSFNDDVDGGARTYEPRDFVLLAESQTAHAATVTLMSGDGRVLGVNDYDLSHRAGRDQLFALAWFRAMQLARHPRRCARMPVPLEIMPPPEIVPPPVASPILPPITPIR